MSSVIKKVALPSSNTLSLLKIYKFWTQKLKPLFFTLESPVSTLFYFMSKIDKPLVFPFVSVHSGPVPGHHWKEPGSIFASSLPLNLPVSVLYGPSSLRLSSEERCSCPSVFLAFIGLSPACLCVSCTGEPRAGWNTPAVCLQCWAEGQDH